MARLLRIGIPMAMALLIFSGCAQERVKTTNAVASMRAAKDAIASAIVTKSAADAELDELVHQMNRDVEAALTSGEPVSQKGGEALETATKALNDLHDMLKREEHMSPGARRQHITGTALDLAELVISDGERWLKQKER